MALRSDVAHLQHGLARNLLLDVEVVVLHVGHFDIAVESESIAFVAGAGGREYRASGDDLSADRTVVKDRSGADVVIGRAGIEVRRIRQVAHHHVLRESVVEHSEAGADYGLTISRDVPREAEAGSEIFLVRVVETAQTGLANLGESESVVSGVEIGDVAEQVIFLPHDSEIIPSHAVVESQPWGQAEAVLSIEAEVVLVGMARGIAEVLEAGGWSRSTSPARKSSMGLPDNAVPVEDQSSAEVLIEKLLHGGAMETRNQT